MADKEKTGLSIAIGKAKVTVSMAVLAAAAGFISNRLALSEAAKVADAKAGNVYSTVKGGDDARVDILRLIIKELRGNTRELRRDVRDIRREIALLRASRPEQAPMPEDLLAVMDLDDTEDDTVGDEGPSMVDAPQVAGQVQESGLERDQHDVLIERLEESRLPPTGHVFQEQVQAQHE